MVVIIKGNNEASIDEESFKLVAKQIINMETNLEIFSPNGDIINYENSKPKIFHSYAYKNVIFEPVQYSGTIIIYTNNIEISYDNYVVELKKHLETYAQLNNKAPVYITRTLACQSKTYAYIQDKTKLYINRQFTNKKTNNHKYIYSKSYDMSSEYYTFEWSIIIINKLDKNYYLMLAELYSGDLSSEYLLESPYTILYDNLNIFVPNFVKQLDYPYVNQYQMGADNSILSTPIYINKLSNLGFYYMSKILNIKIIHSRNLILFDMYHLEYSSNSPNDTYKNIIDYENILYETFGSIHNNINHMLGKKYDIIKETPKILRCFLTNMPLYDTCYVVKLIYYINETPILKHILISNIVIESRVTKVKSTYTNISCVNAMEVILSDKFKLNAVVSIIGKIDLTDNNKISYILFEKDITILNVYDIINMLDISNLEKKILIALEKNGAVFEKDKYSKIKQIKTINLEANEIYIGFPNITDYHIIKFTDTPAILFKFKELR